MRALVRLIVRCTVSTLALGPVLLLIVLLIQLFWIVASPSP